MRRQQQQQQRQQQEELGPELRIDPADGNPRTLAELRALCKGDYAEEEILEYWALQMLPHQGQRIHNVANDPFLTHPDRLAKPAAPLAVQSPPQPKVSTQTPPKRGPTQSECLAAAENTVAEENGSGGVGRPGLPQGSKFPDGAEPEPPQARHNGPEMGRISAPGIGASGAREVDVTRDPFLVATGGCKVADGQPLAGVLQPASQAEATTWGPGRGLVAGQKKLHGAVREAWSPKRPWAESLVSLLGPGQPGREASSQRVLVLGPWALFLWTLLLGLVLRHFCAPAAFGLIGLFILLSLVVLLLWAQGQRAGPISRLAVGCLCLLAVTAGALAGLKGWNEHWRQFWWMQTGFRGAQTTALTPAAARSDHAVLDFWDANLSTTLAGTRVDHLKAAGFKDTDYYCVAPILSPAAAGSTLTRVNFWAIGINCCQRYGSFTCDDSREWNAGKAVVMLNGGLPCPTCNREQFRAAVAKAEAVHGLVSMEGALFVRWVQEPSAYEVWALAHCLGYLAFCSVLAFVCFLALGSAAWYYGLGIQQQQQQHQQHGQSPMPAGAAYGSALAAAEPLVP